jgi:exoribonuclease-2
MIALKSLVVYKTRPALVTETGEKIGLSLPGGESLRVREKDIELIHPGPCGPEVLEPEELAGDVRGAWEILEGASVSLKDLAELVYEAYTPQTAWAAYSLLQEGIYFSGTIRELSGRDAAAVEAEERKREEKHRDALERGAFLERLRAGRLELPQDSRFLQDVEALAYGKTDKCRTVRDLGRPETAQEAHRLLLAWGVWTVRVNPHPARYNLSLSSAKTPLPPPPEEERRDLTALEAIAIDNPWSADPDDAVSLEGNILWVHVADPAASVLPGSPADREARNRGATLYLPEGSARMLAEEALPAYALGLAGVSPALSFRITLAEDGSPVETEIAPSRVAVIRRT